MEAPTVMAAVNDASLAMQLDALLNEELHLCERLRGQLQQELSLLQNHEHEAGLAALPEKQALLDTLRHLAAQRTQLLHHHGFATLTDCLATLPAEDATMLRPIHAALRALGQACLDENRHLGQFIHRQTRFVEFLLTRLLPARHDALTYDEDGRRPNDSSLGPGVTV